MADYGRSLGCSFFSYIMIRGLAEESSIFLTSYDNEWRERYSRKLYKHYDPVAVMTRRSRLPFFWEQREFIKPFFKSQKRVFFEAREFKIAAGYSVPVAGPNGDLAVFTVADSSEAALIDAVRAHSSEIVRSALHAHDRAMFLCNAGDSRAEGCETLTARELECLKWTADGLTTDEISDKMLIASPTVNYHLNKAVAKLNASNRHHAAIIAIRRGWI